MTHRVLRGIAGAVLVATAAVGTTVRAETIAGLKLAEPQPTAQQLMAGLAVEYTYAVMNHVDELKGRKFESGLSLPHLNYRMGSGTVLTSKASDGVGAIITGFIQFEKPGTYGLDVTSNDGVRVEIGGKLIHEDPGVHGDTTSERIDVTVATGGWYPIKIVYFEKRNTATLIVRWIGPGEKGGLVPVPAKAFAHLRK